MFDNWSTLKKLIWNRAFSGGTGPEYKTKSGTIVHITDALAAPIKKLTAQITPVQDLHGQDAPYPPGGGKNLLPNNATSATASNVTYTVNSDGTIAASGTSSGWNGLRIATITLAAGSYIISSGLTTGFDGLYLETSGAITVSTNNTGGAKSFDLSESGEITVKLFARPGRTYSQTVYPMIRLASVSDGTYAPYSNICPISGWTGLEGKRTGVNVWDEEIEAGSIYTSTGGDNNSSSALSGTFRSKNYIPVKENTSYYFKPDSSAVSGNVVSRLFFYGKDKEFISSPSGSSSARAFTTPNKAYFVRFFVNKAVTSADGDGSINYPSTDTDYHAYSSETLSVSWQDTAGTVYGGNIVVNEDGSGGLTVGMAIVDLGTLDWTTYSTPDRHVFRSAYPPPRPYVGDNALPPHALCSSYYPMAYSPISASDNGAFSLGNERVVIIDHRFTDASSFATAVHGVQLCYELATPITYTLPDVTMLTTLLGTNNIWVDTGDVSVEYRADTKRYVDKKIAEIVNS